MTSPSLRPGGNRVAFVLARWVRDVRGAALLQFVAILPVIIILFIGLWALYVVYSAHQTLCESTWEASRYLQVEGPYFNPDEMTYPDDWRTVATGIINTSLRNNALVEMQVSEADVRVWPDANVGASGHPEPPKEQGEVRAETVRDAWFFVRATATITHPLGFLLRTEPTDPSVLRLTCQSTGFYETEPLQSTDIARPGATRIRCERRPQNCTQGPGPTECNNPPCPTHDPCVCR